MDTPKQVVLPERNPKTHAIHRREVFWQITLPLIVGILLLLATVAAVIYSATQPAAELDRWGDVSLMWLILPSLFFALIILLFLVGMVYLISQLLRLIPPYARVVQLYFEAGKTKVGQLSDLSVKPIIRVRSLWAIIRHAGKWSTKPTNLE
jgi:uncharacterized protein involved in cysteine biosynthesis